MRKKKTTDQYAKEKICGFSVFTFPANAHSNASRQNDACSHFNGDDDDVELNVLGCRVEY